VAPLRTKTQSKTVQDHVALAEIELCGELMIAASAAEAAGEERLSPARIDEVLRGAGEGQGRRRAGPE